MNIQSRTYIPSIQKAHLSLFSKHALIFVLAVLLSQTLSRRQGNYRQETVTLLTETARFTKWLENTARVLKAAKMRHYNVLKP